MNPSTWSCKPRFKYSFNKKENERKTMKTAKTTKMSKISKVSKTKKQLRNNVILILDNSGSMQTVRLSAHKAFNNWLENLKKESKIHKQQTNLTLMTFGSNINIKIKNSSINDVEPLNIYNPMENTTRLFDAVAQGIEEVEDVKQSRTKYDDSFLVVTLTDGQNNAGSYNNKFQVPITIQEKLGKGNWTFVFLCPPNSRNLFSQQFGVSLENILEWESTTEGVQKAEYTTSCGFSNYYSARASGQRSVKNFYTDLSNLKTTDLKKNCDDIKDDCEIFSVPKEVEIKDFVEEKTRRPYVKGSVYYELTKSEKIQRDKDILVMKRGKSSVYENARELIGLPLNVDIKVEPKNHMDYQIFVQSTSVNRRLVRGTKIIIRK